MGLLDDGIHVAEALSRVAILQRRSLDLALSAFLLTAAGTTALALDHARLGFAILIAAMAGAGAAALARSERERELTRLVAAGAQDDQARAFGTKLISPPRRRRLARGLTHAAAAGQPGPQELTHIRPERANPLQDRLLALASAFADQGRDIDTVSAALCRRLLCEPIVSPLYNPRLADDELERTLRAIERGIKSGGARTRPSD